MAKALLNRVRTGTAARHRAVRILALFAALSPAGTACADAISAEPASIGRISYGAALLPGGAICTATLIEPDLILTAGHCVPPGPPGALRFDAGWRDGTARATARGKEVFRPENSTKGIEGDLALVRLDRPIPPSAAIPLPVAHPQTVGLSRIAYSRAAPDRAETVDCTILEPALSPQSEPPPLLGLDCAAVSGNSGAPLVQPGPDGPALVAVTVARATTAGFIGSYAIVPPSALLQAASSGNRP